MPSPGGLLADVASSVGTLQERLAALQASRRVRSDAVISRPFMREHTRFDAFAEFVEASPWSPADPADIREVPRDALDDYVAATTDFETWEELETRAAEEALIEQHLV